MSKSKRNNSGMLKSNDLMIFARKRREDRKAKERRINRFRPRRKNLESWRVSTPKWTVLVRCEADGNIVEAAPIVRKFIGKNLDRLLEHAAKQGGIEVDRLR